MTNERLQGVYSLFEKALDVPAAERERFLTNACAGDVELRVEVASLLDHEDRAGESFLRPPDAPLFSLDDRHDPGPAVTTPASPPAADATAPRASPDPHERPLSPVGPSIEGYEILRELGRGGQAVVFQAIQKSTKRKVAIKVLVEGPYASKAALGRFEREIELVAHLRHPNIISVFHSGQTSDGHHYFVMDYVRGIPLHQYVRDNKLTLEDTVALFATVCEAVQYAHQKGAIHRDLKPANILVDANATPKILDFGLAKLLGGPEGTLISITQQVVGTLPYMSPEQVRGNPDEIDARTDIYALGVVLYELLTGHYPYPVVGQLLDVLRNIAQTPPTPPSRAWQLSSGVARRVTSRFRKAHCPIDRTLEAIIMTALTKTREQRYATAQILADDLRHYLAGERISVRPRSRWHLATQKPRSPRQFAVYACAILVLTMLRPLLHGGYLPSLSPYGIYLHELFPPLTTFNGLEPTIPRPMAVYLGMLALLGLILIYAAFYAGVRRFLPLVYGMLLLTGAMSGTVYRFLATPLQRALAVRGFTGYLCGDPANTLVLGLYDGRIQCEDLLTHEIVRTLPSAYTGASQLRISRDGARLLVCRKNGVVELVDYRSGSSLASVRVDDFEVTGGAFAPDSQRFAVLVDSSWDDATEKWQTPAEGNLRIYSAADGRYLQALDTPVLSGSWQCIAWEGSTIAVAEAYGKGRGVLVLDVTSNQPARVLVHPEGNTPLSVALSRDGSKLAAGYAPYDVAIWDILTGQVVQYLESRNNWVVSLDFSPDGRLLASGEGNSAVRLWNLANGRQIRHFEMGPQSSSCYTYSLSFDATGDRLACGTENGWLVIWHIP